MTRNILSCPTEGPRVGRDWIFESQVSYFRALSSGETRMDLASGVGSVALSTSFRGNGPHLMQWLVALLSAPDGLLTKVFRGLSSVVRQMPGNLCTAPCDPSHSIITIIIFLSSTDRWNICNWLEASGFGLNWLGATAASGHHRLYRKEKKKNKKLGCMTMTCQVFVATFSTRQSIKKNIFIRWLKVCENLYVRTVTRV